MTDRLNDLFARHLERRLTPQEKVELMGLWLEPSLQPELKRLIDSVWETTAEGEGLTDEELKNLFRRLFDKPAEQPKLVRMAGWKRWVAAASIMAILGAGSYFLFFNKKGEQPAPIVEQAKDVKAPQTNRAMVTLANGDKVYLDSAGEGQLASQGNVKLVKLADGGISYEPIVNSSESTVNGQRPVIYNTLANPRGSKVIDMTLSDGSHVWLNAGSSVTYPVAFVGNERKVAISGEAYFEVAHDATKPFIVSKGDVQVQVLGTRFNVNAYDNETEIKVTLLEGSVDVRRESSTKRLKPGQQANVAGDIYVMNAVDLAQVMAWKNGLFFFNRADIKTVMRQIARWYNVEVVYEGNIPVQQFGGKIQRELSLAEVLDILTKSQVHYRIEGRQLTITQ